MIGAHPLASRRDTVIGSGSPAAGRRCDGDTSSAAAMRYSDASDGIVCPLSTVLRNGWLTFALAARARIESLRDWRASRIAAPSSELIAASETVARCSDTLPR